MSKKFIEQQKRSLKNRIDNCNIGIDMLHNKGRNLEVSIIVKNPDYGGCPWSVISLKTMPNELAEAITQAFESEKSRFQKLYNNYAERYREIYR